MATNAMLVKYNKSDELFREEDAKVLESHLIINEILIFIEEKKLTKNIKILEEDTSKKIDITILEIKSLEIILNKIKEIVKEKSKLLSSDKQSEKEEDVLLNDCRTLLNLRGLFLEKVERYSNENHILIQIG